MINVVTRWFERVTMTVILINCVTLGLYKPCTDSRNCNQRCAVLKFADHAIYVYFAAEMLIKMVS